MPHWRVQAYRTMALKLHPDKRKSTQREGACACGSERRRRSNAASCCLCAARTDTPGPLRAVAEREFNLLQKAYEMLWCAAAATVALFAPRP
jgi:curved DNA-binding protein CbpA